MRRPLYSILLIIIILMVVFSVVRLFGQNLALKGELGQLEREQEKLEKRQKYLSESYESLSSPEVLEREARLRLNYQKEGEYAVIIVPPREEEVVVGSENIVKDYGILANPIKWFKFIFSD
jgi:cell division protein FtsB